MHIKLFSLCVFLFCVNSLQAANQHQAGAQLTYSSNPATILVSLSTVSPELASPDPIPLLRIYADGRLRVHYPAYLKRAGDYEMYLAPDQLDSLLKDIAPAVLNFNSRSVQVQKNEFDYQQVKSVNSLSAVEVFYVADADITVVNLNIKSYQAAGSQVNNKLNQPLRISWSGLSADAKHYPNLASIQALDQAAIRLFKLSTHKQLQRMETGHEKQN